MRRLRSRDTLQRPVSTALRLGVLAATLHIALALAPPAAASTRPPRLSSIALAPAGEKLSLIPGETFAIRATATYTDGTTEDVTERLVYQSNKPEVVAIVGTALVEARRSGDAEISAVDPLSGKSARTKVKFKVAKLKAIELLPADKVVVAGDTLALRALGRYDNGRSGVDLTHAVVWSSDKVKVATVGNGDEDAGLVSGVKAGSVKIIALEPVDRIKSTSDSGRVSVVERLSAITVEPRSISLRNGRSAALSAYGRYEGGARIDLTDRVEWTSSDPDVAVIDAGGLLSTVGIGTTSVNASDPVTGVHSGTASSDASVNVLGALVGLVVSPPNATIPIGGVATLRTLAAFEGVEETVRLESGVQWKTSNAKAFAIDAATGAGRCQAAGAAIVSVVELESGMASTDFSGDARVACVAESDAVRTTPASALLATGKTKPLRAFLVQPDGTEREVTSQAAWTSSHPQVVGFTTGPDGLPRAKALAPGVAIVTARDPVTGVSSADQGGTTTKISVPGRPKILKIFPRPESGSVLGLTEGVSFLLKARVDFEGGATQGANNLVEWVSSDPTILQVSNGENGVQPGRSEPLRAGQVTVTIHYPKPGAPPPPFPPDQPMSTSVQVRVTP